MTEMHGRPLMEKIAPAAAAGLAAFVFGLYGPFQMVIGNREFFWFSLSDVWGYFVLCALGVFAILTAGCVLLPGRGGRVLTALVFGIGLALYLEGAFMPMDYGLLDGQAVDWRAYSGRMIIDAALWVLCLAGLVVFSLKNGRLFKRVVSSSALFIVIVQAGSLAFSLFTMPQAHNKPQLFSDDGKFDLSTRENIIVFVLDGFEHRLFERIAAEIPEYLGVFKDFTLFDDVTSGHRYTRPSIPFILTGRMYDNLTKYRDFLEQSYRDMPLLRTLHEHAFDNRLYTYLEFTPASDPVLSQYFNRPFEGTTVKGPRRKIGDPLRLVRLMYKLTATRYVPIAFKKVFWMYSDDFEAARVKRTPAAATASPDLLFYRTFREEGLRLFDDKNAFRFYHLRGAHQPWTLTEDLEGEKADEISTAAYYGQAKASLKIVRAFLDELKRTGLYESSFIIVMADHGLFLHRTFVNFRIPLLMVKLPGTRNGLATSSAPVTTGDVASTILSFVTPKYRAFGPSLFDIKENERRERRFLFGFEEQNDEDYMSALTEWITVGKASDRASWKKTGRLFAAGRTVLSRPRSYKPGEILTFEPGSPAYDFADIGLLESDGDYAYTTEDRVDIVLKTGTLSGDMVLKLQLSGVLSETPAGGRRIGLLVNGQRIPEEFRITEPKQNVTFNISRDYFLREILRLSLLCPDAQYPAYDQRSFGQFKVCFFLHSLTLEPVSKLNQGTVIPSSRR